MKDTLLGGKFVRQKTYIEEFLYTIKKVRKTSFKLKGKIKNKKINKIKREIKITCAGMPSRCYKYVDWDSFKTGFACPR